MSAQQILGGPMPPEGIILSIQNRQHLGIEHLNSRNNLSAIQPEEAYNIEFWKEKELKRSIKQKQKETNWCWQKFINLFNGQKKPDNSKNFDKLSASMSHQLEKQKIASKNWDIVRKRRLRIVGMGMMKSHFSMNREASAVVEEQSQPTKYVIMPDSFIKIQFDAFINLSYVISFLLIPYVIAFNIEPLKQLRWAEFTFDIIIVINIISIFFTAQFNDEDVVNQLGLIAKNYLKGYFVLDALSVLPGIITVERVKWVYYFKLLRYVQIERLFDQISILETRIKRVFMSNQDQSNNFFVILKTLLYLTVLFHWLSCIWILVGNTEGGWRTLLDSDDANDQSFVYITSIYFIVATASTVGYGDNYARNSNEKGYLLFLEFAGILIFSWVAGSITSLRKPKQVTEILDEKQGELEIYLSNIDMQVENDLDSEMYDQALQYIKTSYIKGVALTLNDGDFFKLLPPRLKNSLISEIMEDYHSRFYYFFHDISSKNHADQVFIRKVLSSLDCQVFPAQKPIIEAGEIVPRLYFVYEGNVLIRSSMEEAIKKFNDEVKATIINVFNSNKDQDKLKSRPKPVLISVLPPGSFFGDYQILFNLPSNYDYVSLSEKETLCMSIGESRLLSICEMFPRFHSFLCQRALVRRNHFKKIENKVKEQEQNQIRGLKIGKFDSSPNRLNKSVRDDTDMAKYSSGRHYKDQINNKDREELLDKQLLVLSDLEIPKFKYDQQQLELKFTTPILRMYIQGVQQIANGCRKFTSKRFDKYNELFDIQRNLLDNMDLKHIKKLYEVYRCNKLGGERHANKEEKKILDSIKQREEERSTLKQSIQPQMMPMLELEKPLSARQGRRMKPPSNVLLSPIEKSPFKDSSINKRKSNGDSINLL